MTNEDLDALDAKAREAKELAEKATPGPWGYKAGAVKHYVFSKDAGEDFGFSLQEFHWEDGRPVPAEANARFVAASRSAWPESADAALALSAELRRERAARIEAERWRDEVRGELAAAREEIAAMKAGQHQ